MSSSLMKNPIFICGSHKSGTSLLRALLDGHSDLFVIPIEAHIFQYSNHWVDYRLRRAKPTKRSMNEIKEAYIKIIKEVNEKTTQVADADVTGKLNVSDFINEINKETKNFKELIIQYFQAIYKSLFGTDLPSNLRVVEKTVENAEVAEYLKRLFPDAKFIHILRNPYSNLVSLRKSELSRGKQKYPFLFPLLETLENSYYFLYRNMQLLKNDYLVIKYEDLLETPEKIMRQIANHISIEFQDNIMKPTAIGENWAGNSSRGLIFNGINKENAERWKSEMNHLESFYVTRYFSFVLQDFGYDKFIIKKSNKRRVKGEGLKTYFRNRLIPYFYK
ncbi:MAG: sulfotransferase [Candidatus Hodarchaeota archaeon]